MKDLFRMLCLIVLTALIHTSTNAQPDVGDEATEGVITAYKAGDFAALDKLATRLRKQKDRTPSGRWFLSVFYANLDSAILEGNEKNTEAQWADIESKLNRWVAAFPQSATAPIALSTAQRWHAWALRGHGYAGTVTPKGWEDFAKHMAIARNTLEKNRRISGDDPHWYVAMLRVALAQGWKQEQYWALYEEALSKEPLFYETYFQAAERVLPIWGGSLQEVADFAAASVKRTASAEGQGMYARIYWALENRLDSKEFFAEGRKSLIWARMKSGFASVIEKYPSDFNKNAYAKYACRFGDSDAFVSAVQSFKEKKPDVEIWTGGYSNYFQKCKDHAAKLYPHIRL